MSVISGACAALWLVACDSSEVTGDAGVTLDAGADVHLVDSSLRDVPAEDAADSGIADSSVEDAPLDASRPDGFTLQPLAVEEVPAGLVPVAIALAHGRIVTSCDHMQTIALDETFSPEANDHHEHALKGAAFGNGVFVISTGHGAPGHVLRSSDGLDWTQLSGESFHYADGSTGLLSGGTAGVVFDGSEFILLRGRGPRMSSSDGAEWTEFGEELDRRYFHHRGHQYFPDSGRLFIEGQNVDQTERWLLLSEDSGRTFREVDYDELCRVPLVDAHNMMVAGGTEMQLCRSFDDGETWRAEATPDDFGNVLATNEGLVALRGWRSTLHRFDGEGWSEETIDSSIRWSAAARSPWGWYWFVSRQAPRYWLSEDTRTFRMMDAASEGQNIRRFVFGYAEPSERCPLLEEK